MIESKLAPIPQNYMKQVDYIFHGYEDAGVSLANGFQKDCIQNSVGARRTNGWKNWTCSIYTVKNKFGSFLVVEDSGTEGLTGPNLNTNEIQQLINNGGKIVGSSRLARFSSMNNSGDNKTGGGLYGVGKIIYTIASKDYIYYFDSLRSDGKYVANMNFKGNILDLAFENDQAKIFIKDKTGFDEKKTIGTRVIIFNPKEELVEAINNGAIQKYIQETWWLILKRLDNTAGIFVNGKKIELPTSVNYTRLYDLPQEEVYRHGYRIKHFGFYISEDKLDDRGISYYRKGMKIGEVELKDIPDKIKDKFWGYIEVDEPWEEELAQIEDIVHFGISKGMKNKSAYQFLKGFSNERCRRLLIEWGFIRDKEHEDQKLRDELKHIAEDIQDLFDNLGYEDLGKGPNKPDFDVRWQNIQYPTKGSERVTAGEEIGFGFRIKNEYITKKVFEYSLSIIREKDKKVIYNLSNEKVSIDSGEVFVHCLSLPISCDVAERYEENRVLLKVHVQSSGKVKVKELPFFFDIDKPDNMKEKVILTLHSCKFPVEGSRRINFGDTLTNLAYRVENKRINNLKFRLNISIHNATDPSLLKIEDISSRDFEVNPYEEIVFDIPDIIFEESKYKQYLEKGILELRARLIATEDSGEFEKGDKITDYRFKIYFNRDERNGKSDAFQTKTVEAPENYRRTWFEKEGNDRTIYINCSHSAYLFVKESQEMQSAYLKEQVLKQYVLIYLEEGKYSMFCSPDETFTDFDVVKASEQVIEKIEEIYYKSLT